jgi:hypothetical protein
MTPTRIKRGGQRKKLPDGARWCGRPSRWGNPFRVGSAYAVIDGSPSVDIQPGRSAFAYPAVEMMTAAQCVEAYRHHARRRLAADPKWLEPLRGCRFLACECEPGESCHVDVLIEMLTGGR